MSLRDIVSDKDPKLRCKSREVVNFDAKLAKLIDDLKDTLSREAGVGLAAPQVGILRRVFIIETEDLQLECVNPVILSEEGEDIAEEACLSCDTRRGLVKRPLKINVEFYDRNGKKKELELEGFNARVFCHEFDHLNGILFYDREVFEE